MHQFKENTAKGHARGRRHPIPILWGPQIPSSDQKCPWFSSHMPRSYLSTKKETEGPRVHDLGRLPKLSQPNDPPCAIEVKILSQGGL